jgi:formamidopyrimidine-DNA glycosylase
VLDKRAAPTSIWTVPELPDVTLYLEHLERRLVGQTLVGVRVQSPFLLRSVDPPLSAAIGRRVVGLRRIGKRLVFSLEGDLFLVLHLMIAGRLHWKDEPGAKIPGKVGLAAFDFDNGTLILTEAAKKKRASLHVVSGEEALRALDRGGIEPLEASRDQFRRALLSENHTLKRSLTDPTLFAGIGNAYSDEILHAAKLSPVALTSRLGESEVERLYHATRETLRSWMERLRAQAGAAFPEKVTAFRPEMAVHGRYGLPCPACGAKVQRIVYADNETNYCPHCQTGGKLLADRSLSRLLKGDWPRSPEDMEEWKRQSREPTS